MNERVTVNKTGQDSGGAAVIDFDPFSPEVIENPFPWYEAIRQYGPIVKLKKYPVWAAFDFAEVDQILRDHEQYSSAGGVGISNFHKEKPWRTPSVILEADPPLHGRTRGVLNRVLSPKVLRSMQDMFAEQAEEFVERVVDMGSFDAVKDLAEPYPVKVFPDALGLPEQGRHHLFTYGNITFNAICDKNEIFKQAQEQGMESVQWVMNMCDRESLTPDGIGARIYDAYDKGELSEEEAPLLVRSFLSAGVDTTVTGIGNAIYAYSRFPDQWQYLLDNPGDIRRSFDEVLRWGGAVIQFFRTTTGDVEISDVHIPKDEKILVVFAAANRDPKKWESPDKLDLSRNVTGHVAFGVGIHGCVGQMVARMEAELIFSAFARRVKRFQLTGEPKIKINNALRGFETLPVKVVCH